MRRKNHGLKRVSYVLSALALTVAALLPGINQSVSAAQLVSRSVQMSNSAPSATGVQYLFTFTPATSAQSIVIDFCGDSPILGSTCDVTTNATTGLPSFDASGATLTAGSLTNWTLTAATTNLKLTRATGSATGTGSPINFTINNITNINVARSFYARITTYTDTAYGSYASPTSLGTYADYGGIALSTANTISVTARVMETLVFCVSGAAPTSGCGGVSTPAVTLGHGTPAVIDAQNVDTNASVTPTYTQLSTNAASGATVRMKNANACGGLSKDGGTTCDIAATNAGATAAAIAAGSAKFGLGVGAGSGGTGTVTPNAKYAASTGYGMDPSSSTGVTSTYGDPIMASTAPVSSVNNQLTFAATAGTTTPAGVYTATLTLIATGIF